MHLRYPQDKFLKADTFSYNFLFYVSTSGYKPAHQFMNPMADHLFPCISVRHNPRGRSVYRVEYTIVALIYISLITNEVQQVFHMFIGYLNFFFSKMSICAIFFTVTCFSPFLTF